MSVLGFWKEGSFPFSLTSRQTFVCCFPFLAPPNLALEQQRMQIFRDNKSSSILLVVSLMSGVRRIFKAQLGPQCLYREGNIFHFVKLFSKEMKVSNSRTFP
jgi:hypothetical protein